MVWVGRPRNQVFDFWQSQNKNANIIMCLNRPAVSKTFIFWLKFTFYGTDYATTQNSPRVFSTHITPHTPNNRIWWIFDRASWYRIEILQPTWCTIFFIQQLYHIMLLYMFRASQRSSSGGHCIYAVSGFLTLCMLPYVAQIESGQIKTSPLLICATYGSIQSVRKPDTAYVQCPPGDERCDARNM
jgi:hypothetical protein